MSDGIPKEVSAAFAPDTVRIAGRVLQPLSSLHFLALDKFAPALARGGAADGVESFVGLMLLTTPAADLRALMGRTRAEMEQAAYDLAATISFADLLAWPATLAAHLDAAFSTALAGKGEAQKKTESAGGSPSSNGPAPSTAGDSTRS